MGRFFHMVFDFFSMCTIGTCVSQSQNHHLIYRFPNISHSLIMYDPPIHIADSSHLARNWIAETLRKNEMYPNFESTTCIIQPLLSGHLMGSQGGISSVSRESDLPLVGNNNEGWQLWGHSQPRWSTNQRLLLFSISLAFPRAKMTFQKTSFLTLRVYFPGALNFLKMCSPGTRFTNKF